MSKIDLAPAVLENIFVQLKSLNSRDRTWLEIAERLLKFCYDYAPSASSWEGLDPGEPWRTVKALKTDVLAELARLDPTYIRGQLGQGPYTPAVVSSFATHDHVDALRRFAATIIAANPFGDVPMSRAAVARAMADAIDDLASSTFMEGFKSRGTMKLVEGTAYPACRHNPSSYLPPSPVGVGRDVNTPPRKFPTRQLWATKTLCIATGRLNFDYVLDFGLWDRLSVLGSDDVDLKIAVAQPNLGLDDFDFRPEPVRPITWYANHGPKETDIQLSRITRLLGKASGADIVLLPEYAVSAAVHTKLAKQLPSLPTPIIFCAGVTSPDTNDFVNNQAWLYVSTPNVDPGYTEHLHAKTSRAYLGTWVERIHTTSEVRVFISQQWNLCVLICIETLSNEILNQLAELGTNLLLVPAMSAKTNSMTDKMSSLCSDSQAFVVMANGPASWPTLDDERYELFIAGPYAHTPRRWGRNRARGGHPPKAIALWEFSSARRRVNLTQLPP
jgi:predicted amidohydrolase